MKIISRTKGIIKKYKKTSIIVLVLIVAATSFFIFRESADTLAKQAVKVAIGTITQEVSVTGRVKPAQAVDLSFNHTGRIIAVNVKAGDKVHFGQILAQLDSSELLAQRQREVANVNAAEQRLNQVIASANGSQTLNNSTTADIFAKALRTSIDAMVDFTAIQSSYFNTYTGEANQLADAKELTLFGIYGQNNLGRVESWYFTNLNTGLKSKIDKASFNSLSVQQDELLVEVKNAMFATKNALELMYSRINSLGVAATNVATIKSDIDLVIAQISALTNQNKSLIGENYEIAIARSQLEQAKATLAILDAQIAKNILRAPFAGIIASVDIERGEMVGGSSVISMISTSKYEIEVNVSEADIAKIKIGNQSVVTFDAYGSDKKFEAVIVHIDPVAKIIDSVATYKVKLQFAKSDELILVGLTADIDIKTNEKQNVLFVPSRDVIFKDGKKFVKVLQDIKSPDVRFASLTAVSKSKKEQIFEVEVQTGLKGSDGRIEIISGVKDGDRIVKD